MPGAAAQNRGDLELEKSAAILLIWHPKSFFLELLHKSQFLEVQRMLTDSVSTLGLDVNIGKCTMID